MERMIGVLKAMISQRANIDRQLANSIERTEHLNHLHMPRLLVKPRTQRSRDATYPILQTLSSKKRMQLSEHLPISQQNDNKWNNKVLATLQTYCGNEKMTRYPIDTSENQIQVYKKANIRWKLTIGSELSNDKDSIKRRDDSYIRYKVDGEDTDYYGRVVCFVAVLDWKLLAIVRGLKVKERSNITPPEGMAVASGPLLKEFRVIKVKHIQNLIGRQLTTTGIAGGKELYLINTVSNTIHYLLLVANLSTLQVDYNDGNTDQMDDSGTDDEEVHIT